ncbi:hypothetical protein BH10PLA2_BH10PLA2_16320 [soil metagenome]
MFGWVRRPWSTVGNLIGAQLPAFTDYRWPEAISLLSNRADVEASLLRERAVVFISVEWAVQERQSRATFIEFFGRIGCEQPGLVWFGVLSESSEGVGSWFEALALPASAAAGYGALVWLEQGRTVGVESYAAEAGTDKLVCHTLRLWGRAEPVVVLGSQESAPQNGREG